jgi:hypothetical protein
MACTEEEFLELLSDESTVDIIALTEQAKYGIPDKVFTQPPPLPRVNLLAMAFAKSWPHR